MVEEFLKDTGLSAFNGIIGALIILIAGIIALKVVIHFMKKGLKKSTIDPALHKFVLNVVRIAAWIFIVVAVLSELNVNTTTFVAVLSAAGAAIALALKDSLANVAGGIIILITKPFGRGDYVQIAEAEGNIKDIDIITTTMITLDQKTVIIPNGTISSSIVTNYSKQGIRRVDCVFEVSYNASLQRVREILRQVADECQTTIKDREIVIGVSSHDESGVAVDFKVWTSTDDYWTTYYWIHERVKNVFDAEGIDIPYPHMEVMVHNKEH